MQESPNPFAPPPVTSELIPTDRSAESARIAGKLRRPIVSLALWTVVCVISAAPSFYFGYGTVAQEQVAAMCLGIVIFIGIYTAVDQWTRHQSWRQLRNVALTLKIGYCTRILISIVFPIGAAIDVICGLMSVGIVETIVPMDHSHSGGPVRLGGEVNFLSALLITLVQGVVLNIVLFGYMTLMLGIVMLVRPQSKMAVQR